MHGLRLWTTAIGLWLTSMGIALGADYQPQPCQSFTLAGESGVLHAAIFSVGAPFSPGLANSYQRFLAEHGEWRLPEV